MKRHWAIGGAAAVVTILVVGGAYVWYHRDRSPLLAKVGGEKLTKNAFERTVRLIETDPKEVGDLLANPDREAERKQILEGMTRTRAILKLGKLEKVDKDPKVLLRIEQATARIYLNAMMDHRQPKAEPTDPQMKALYDKRVAAMKAAGVAEAPPPFEQVKPQLAQMVKQEEQEKAYQAVNTELARRVPVTYVGPKPAEKPKAAETKPAEAKPAAPSPSGQAAPPAPAKK